MKTKKTLADKYYNPIKIADPKSEIEDLIKNFEDFLDTSTLQKIKNLKQKVQDEPNNLELVQDLVSALENYCYVENGSFLKYSTHPSLRSHVKEARTKLILEYKAVTLSEKLTIDLILSAYFRVLRSSSIYHLLLEDEHGKSTTSIERNRLLKELNKQIEMGTKQYTYLLAVLREAKNPPISVKIKTDNAFIGANQQFNKNA